MAGTVGLSRPAGARFQRSVALQQARLSDWVSGTWGKPTRECGLTYTVSYLPLAPPPPPLIPPPRRTLPSSPPHQLAREWRNRYLSHLCLTLKQQYTVEHLQGGSQDDGGNMTLTSACWLTVPLNPLRLAGWITKLAGIWLDSNDNHWRWWRGWYVPIHDLWSPAVDKSGIIRQTLCHGCLLGIQGYLPHPLFVLDLRNNRWVYYLICSLV